MLPEEPEELKISEEMAGRRTYRWIVEEAMTSQGGTNQDEAISEDWIPNQMDLWSSALQLLESLET